MRQPLSISSSALSLGLLAALLACGTPASAPGSEPVAETTPADAQAAEAELDAPLRPTSWLTLAPVDNRGRRPLRPDAVLARHLLDPSAAAPREGEELSGERGETQVWTRREAAEHGGPAEAGRVGWASTELEAPTDGVWLARLRGAATLFVNGAPVFGDYYAFGQGGVPVTLQAGTNQLYVMGVRGSFKLEFLRPESTLPRAPWADIKPDLVHGANRVGPLGVGLQNASTNWRDDLTLVLREDALFESSELRPEFPLAPLETARLALPQRVKRGARFPADGDTHTRTLELRSASSDELLATHEIKLRLVDRKAARRVTFFSEIDGTVQSYGLREPKDDPKASGAGVLPGESSAGLLLTLHGAGVQGLGQANAYANLEDLWVVAPTNRSPFGFDWQDWGRRDAYEVLEHALLHTGVARDRVVLSGHSMGGHGTWHLAANDPDGFAAAAPSAGWPSFDSYGGRPDGPLSSLWQAADGASQTELLLDNLEAQTLYVLHGSADDNVPPEQAQLMIEALAERGVEVPHHFQNDAGHWWDGEAAEGADCLTWPALIDTLRDARLELMPDELAFTTVHPSVDSRHKWISILRPRHYGAPSRIEASFDGEQLVIRTDNVGAFRLHRNFTDTSHPDEFAQGGFMPALAIVDELPIRANRSGWNELTLEFAPPRLAKEAPARPFLGDISTWRDARRARLPEIQKTPAAGGPFKQAFDHGFVFVVGTAGDPEMDTALLEAGRYLASEWAYRANGYAPVVRDVDLELASLTRTPILLGNADTNSVWGPLLFGQPATSARRSASANPGKASAPRADSDDVTAQDSGAPSPLNVSSAGVMLDETTWSGEDLSAIFLRPRLDGIASGEDRGAALVGAFGFSGLPAVRSLPILAPFVSGAGFPDFLVFDGSALELGDGGVLAAGWFNRWWDVPDER